MPKITCWVGLQQLKNMHIESTLYIQTEKKMIERQLRKKKTLAMSSEIVASI